MTLDFSKIVPGSTYFRPISKGTVFFLISYIQTCRCCNGSAISSSYNLDASRKTKISKVKGHIRQCSEGHGAKTYMGVLSLPRWRAESNCVNIISKHNTHTHAEPAEEPNYHAQLSTDSSKNTLEERRD